MGWAFVLGRWASVQLAFVQLAFVLVGFCPYPVCETLMPLKHPSSDKHDPDIRP